MPLLSKGGPQRQRIEAGSGSPALGSGAMRPCGHRSGVIGIDQRHSIVTFSAPRCNGLRSVRNGLTFPRCRPRPRPAPPGAARSQPQHRWPLSTGLRALSHRAQERRSAVAAPAALGDGSKSKSPGEEKLQHRHRRSQPPASLQGIAAAPRLHPRQVEAALAGYRRRCEADRSHPGHGATSAAPPRESGRQPAMFCAGAQNSWSGAAPPIPGGSRRLAPRGE